MRNPVCLSLFFFLTSCVSPSNQEQNAWRSVPLPNEMGRVSYPNCFTSEDFLYVFGGIDGLGEGPFNNRGFTYDLNQGIWKQWPSSGGPLPKWNASYAFDKDSFYLFGGMEAGKNEPRSDFFRFSFQSMSWTKIPLKHKFKSPARSSLLKLNDEVYLFPADSQTQANGLALLLSGQWIPAPKALKSRSSLVALSSESSLIFWGGFQENKRQGDGFIFDTKTQSWSRIEEYPYLGKRANSQAVLLGNDLYILGGSTADHSEFKAARYSLDTKVWQTLKKPPNLPFSSLRDFQIVKLSEDEILLYGGREVGGARFNPKTFLYKKSSDSWLEIEEHLRPQPTIASCLAPTQHDLVLLGGLKPGSNRLEDNEDLQLLSRELLK